MDFIPFSKAFICTNCWPDAMQVPQIKFFKQIDIVYTCIDRLLNVRNNLHNHYDSLWWIFVKKILPIIFRTFLFAIAQFKSLVFVILSLSWGFSNNVNALILWSRSLRNTFDMSLLFSIRMCDDFSVLLD